MKVSAIIILFATPVLPCIGQNEELKTFANTSWAGVRDAKHPSGNFDYSFPHRISLSKFIKQETELKSRDDIWTFTDSLLTATTYEGSSGKAHFVVCHYEYDQTKRLLTITNPYGRSEEYHVGSQFFKSGGDLTNIKNENIGFFSRRGVTIDYQYVTAKSVSVGYGFVTGLEHARPIVGGLILKNEFIFQNRLNKFVYSPQVSAFTNFVFGYLGAKVSYYTDFKHSTYVVAPEYGVGFGVAYLCWSKNIDLNKNEMLPIAKNNISIKIIIPFEWWSDR